MTISSTSTNLNKHRITLRRHKEKLTVKAHTEEGTQEVINQEYETEDKAKQKYLEIETKIEEIRKRE